MALYQRHLFHQKAMPFDGIKNRILFCGFLKIDSDIETLRNKRYSQYLAL
jgi:hypothetical protein